MRESYVIQYIVIILILVGIVVFKILYSRYRKRKGIKSSPCSCCSSRCSCSKTLMEQAKKKSCCSSVSSKSATESKENGQKETK